ncbi:MAG TPA: MarR family transcriptional regulator [Mycobacteriales bacterium]
MDDVSALEEAISATWSWARAAARHSAHELDPRLDTTAYPLVSMIGWRGAMRPSELSAALHLDKSTVSRQIDAAARLGLLERVPDPDDARAVTVRLTPPALAKMEELKSARMERWRAALAEWAPGDIASLTRLLKQLHEVRLY